MKDIFFKDWETIQRVIIMALLAYVYLILILRITGKRTLSKMNAFDFIITVAYGSTLATIILSKDVTLAEGAAALTMLTLLQFIITWFSVRSKSVANLVKSEPRILYYRDQYLQNALNEERVTEDEVLASVRGSGLADLSKVEAVILETDGSFSVVKKKENVQASTLRNVKK